MPHRGGDEEAWGAALHTSGAPQLPPTLLCTISPVLEDSSSEHKVGAMHTAMRFTMHAALARHLAGKREARGGVSDRGASLSIDGLNDSWSLRST